MAHTDPFLLGPLGAMTRLEGVLVAQGVGVTHERLGGQSVALRGRLSTDVWAVKREYGFAWPLARRAMADRLALHWHGASRQVLRFLDPYQPNLLTFDASVCGAESRNPALSQNAVQLDEPWGFYGQGGTASSVLDLPGLDMPTGTPLVGTVDACCRWTTTAAGGLLFSDSRPWRRSPVLGRPLTFSAYVRGTGAVAPRIYLYATGDTAAVGTPLQGAVTTLSQTWQRVVLTVPAGRSELCAIAALTNTAAGTVQTTGWQLEHAASPSAWTPGGGCPEVDLTSFGDGYRMLGRRAVELHLREV